MGRLARKALIPFGFPIATRDYLRCCRQSQRSLPLREHVHLQSHTNPFPLANRSMRFVRLDGFSLLRRISSRLFLVLALMSGMRGDIFEEKLKNFSNEDFYSCLQVFKSRVPEASNPRNRTSGARDKKGGKDDLKLETRFELAANSLKQAELYECRSNRSRLTRL